ncbi:MAG: TAXI family TRAP transporter solute-binding subunit [Clostridia bacterium]|nr:TAXI family TRAP transporter solute-binding subunit [Clostridia bacterium]
MKKFLAILLTLVLLVTCFAACGGNGTESTTAGNEETTAADVVYGDTTFTNIKVGTGGNTGTYFAFANASTQLLATDAYKFEVVSTGGSQANIEGIDDGDYHMATVQNDVMNYAYSGTNGFAAPIKTFSAIACIYPEVCQLIATEASGIKTVADLAGKNVAIGDAGSGVFYNATQILAAAGLDYEKDIKATFASFGDSATQLKDGTIDAAFITAGTPTTAITELATSTKCVAVDLGDAVITKLMNDYPFYTKYEMTSADYDFITEKVNTVAIMATYVVTNEMSEAQAYEITKNLWENEDMATCHAKAAQLNINTTVDGIGDVPLHPGAAKYYAEKGIIEATAEDTTAVADDTTVAAEETTVAEETTAEETTAEETTAA